MPATSYDYSNLMSKGPNALDDVAIIIDDVSGIIDDVVSIVDELASSIHLALLSDALGTPGGVAAVGGVLRALASRADPAAALLAADLVAALSGSSAAVGPHRDDKVCEIT